MREIRIPKGDGRFRVVYAPSRRERRRLQRLLPTLAAAERAAARALGTEAVAHGFVQGRSPVTCALAHVGYPVTICCDLAGWFNSVRPEQIADGLHAASADPGLADKVCYRGAPRQGLPTSPVACNLAAAILDRSILAWLQTVPCATAYTRYADDLSVSLAEDELDLIEAALHILDSQAWLMGWRLAEAKTRIQRARAGRRVIVGVSVGERDIRAPRRVRRMLRGLQHAPRRHGSQCDCVCPYCRALRRRRALRAAGLAEWCAMRLPRV